MRTKLYVVAVIVLLAAGGGAAWWVKDRVAGEPAGFARPQKPAAAPVSTPAPAAGDNYDGNYDDGYGPGAGAPKAAVGIKVTSLTRKSVPRMGEVVLADGGWVLYRFDRDTAAPPASNCTGGCADKWPPVLVERATLRLTGLDQKLVGTVTRPDGAIQVTIGGWPVYRYTGDEAPGKWRGQAVGGTWFVVTGTGKKNLSCLPSASPSAG